MTKATEDVMAEHNPLFVMSNYATKEAFYQNKAAYYESECESLRSRVKELESGVDMTIQMNNEFHTREDAYLARIKELEEECQALSSLNREIDSKLAEIESERTELVRSKLPGFGALQNW